MTDPRLTEAMAKLETDLSAWAEKNVIGQARADDELTPQWIAQGVREMFQAGGMEDVSVVIEPMYACSEVLEDDGYEIVATCDFRRDPPGRWNLWQRFLLWRTNSPGRCPIHKRKLDFIYEVVAKGQLPEAVEYVQAKARID